MALREPASSAQKAMFLNNSEPTRVGSYFDYALHRILIGQSKEGKRLLWLTFYTVYHKEPLLSPNADLITKGYTLCYKIYLDSMVHNGFSTTESTEDDLITILDLETMPMSLSAIKTTEDLKKEDGSDGHIFKEWFMYMKSVDSALANKQTSDWKTAVKTLVEFKPEMKSGELVDETVKDMAYWEARREAVRRAIEELDAKYANSDKEYHEYMVYFKEKIRQRRKQLEREAQLSPDADERMDGHRHI